MERIKIYMLYYYSLVAGGKTYQSWNKGIVMHLID